MYEQSSLLFTHGTYLKQTLPMKISVTINMLSHVTRPSNCLAVALHSHSHGLVEVPLLQTIVVRHI